jgi:hypothetical protein
MPSLLLRARKLGLICAVLFAILNQADRADPGRMVIARSQVIGQVAEVSSVSVTILNYQGRLVDPATGNAKPNGTYPMVFRLYNSPVGGAVLWTETKSITLTNGFFSTLLGDTASFNLSQFDGQSLWLGITVNADPELTPRLQLAAVPYAFYANDAGKLGGQAPSAYAAAAHTHTGAQITDGSITAGDIADRVRNISFPANALNHAADSTIITNYEGGLRWKANYQNAAYLMLAKPADWDGSSAVTLNLHFYGLGSTGNVDFFVRPRSYTPGNLFADAISVNSSAVPLTQFTQIGEQSFTVQASALANRLWVFTLQRGGTGETYTSDVVLMAVEVIYTAVQ